MLCTESRIREAVRAACAYSSGPYWVRDGRDGPERALYVYRHNGQLQLRQVCGIGAPAKPSVDPVLASASMADPAEAYAILSDAIEARGFTIG